MLKLKWKGYTKNETVQPNLKETGDGRDSLLHAPCAKRMALRFRYSFLHKEENSRASQKQHHAKKRHGGKRQVTDRLLMAGRIILKLILWTDRYDSCRGPDNYGLHKNGFSFRHLSRPKPRVTMQVTHLMATLTMQSWKQKRTRAQFRFPPAA